MPVRSHLPQDNPQVPPLLKKLERLRGNTRSAHYGVITGTVVVFVSIGFSVAWKSPFPTIATIVQLLCAMIKWNVCSDKEVNILKELASFGDIRSIPIFLDTFFHTDAPAYAYLPTVMGLSRALPKVKADEVSSFNKRHIDLLHSIIVYYSPNQLNSLDNSFKFKHQRKLHQHLPPEACYALREGILKAFVHIGNEETAHVLTHFIQEDSDSKGKTDLQELARISLLKLQARLPGRTRQLAYFVPLREITIPCYALYTDTTTKRDRKPCYEQ